jgi:GTP-sensing pleiotropic transcriptional regulator CodY
MHCDVIASDKASRMFVNPIVLVNPIKLESVGLVQSLHLTMYSVALHQKCEQ